MIDTDPLPPLASKVNEPGDVVYVHDVTLTVAADLLYRELGRRLKGFEKASPYKLFRKFVDTTGSVEIEEDKVIVRLVKRAHNPLLKEAAKTYNIPIVRHDFPLPKHNWSFEAAVIARYFDSKSKALGFAWRDYCFENQPAITPENLRSNAEKFAVQNKTTLPFVVDPDGKFAIEVKADFALGQRVGIEHTPTIYVVSSKTYGKPFVEVVDRSQLYSIIDQMKTEVGSSKASSVKSAKTTRVAKK